MTTGDLVGGAGTAHDSLTIGLWTAVSRATGLLRVVAIGAVLGPTLFGNTYQVTNSLPNLIYYGFLAGSLLCSLLVPALVRHIDDGRVRETARVSGGFLGIAFVALALLGPLAVCMLPEVMRVVSSAPTTLLEDQEVATARVLMLMTVPQVFLYAVVGASTAVMYAHRRFALPAAAPALENIGIIAVLGVVAVRWGTGAVDTEAVPAGELVTLGLGSTAAVAVHAALQWWGASRTGVRLRPRAGWRDPDLILVIRRAARAVAQAGLLALQVLTLMVLATRVPGGAVALQIALNFYYLPIALVAAPVGLALLPRLSRLWGTGEGTQFTDTFRQGLNLAVFLVVPAAFGYALLARPLAHVVAAGGMNATTPLSMVAGALTALAVGLVGEAAFFIFTQGCYARGDASTPLWCMALQTLVCLALSALAARAAPDRMLFLIAGSYATAALVGAASLYLRTRARWGPSTVRTWPTCARALVGAALMAVPVHAAAVWVSAAVPGRWGWLLAVVVAGGTGLLVLLLAQKLMRAPEIAWLLPARRRAATEPVISKAEAS